MNLDILQDLVKKQAEYGASTFIHAMMSDDPKVHQRAIEALTQLEEELAGAERTIRRLAGKPDEQIQVGEDQAFGSLVQD